MNLASSKQVHSRIYVNGQPLSQLLANRRGMKSRSGYTLKFGVKTGLVGNKSDSCS